MTLLLLSNSRNPGGEYLGHALDAFVTVWADVNTRSRSRLDPERERARNKAPQGEVVATPE